MAGVQFIGNLRSAPVWAKDFGGREHIMPFGVKLDPTQFTDQAGVPVTVATGGAAQGATSIPITALNYGNTTIASTVLIAQGNVIVPAGTTLVFGTTKFATTTVDAVYGATTLTVQPLVTALVAGDAATYTKYGSLFVPSGTLIGRTAAMQTAGTPFRPAITTAGSVDAEIYLTYFDCPNIKDVNNAEVYRPTSLVAINFLPNYANLKTSDIAAISSIYQVTYGVG